MKLSLKQEWELSKNWLFDFSYSVDIGRKDDKGEAIYTRIYRLLPEKTIWVVAGTAFMLLWAVFIVSFLQWLISLSSVSGFFSKYSYILWPQFFLSTNVFDSVVMASFGGKAFLFFYSCMFAPVWEEGLWRKVWLGGGAQKVDIINTQLTEAKKRFGPLGYSRYIHANSIVFGLVHGSPINILIQGIGGYILSFIYLRTGRSYWSSVTAHALYNGTLFAFALSGSKAALLMIIL